jgi:tetratricopeptide (TPR) repeat protein
MQAKQQSLVLIAMAAITVALLGPVRLDCQEASPQALYDQAGQALDAGNTAQAIKLYEELLQKAPDSIAARINLGAALAQQGRYDEAMQQYRKVLLHEPRNETALLNLGLALYKQSDFTKARGEFDELHKLRPANQQAFYLLADCDLRLGRLKDAIALVEPAYEAHPDDPALEYIFGTALIQDGQTQKGAAVIDRIMRSGNSAAASVLMGAAQFAAGDYKTAAATLKNALDLNPNIPGAWTIYGRALLGSSENERAKEAFRRALEADPNDFDACLHLGGVLRHDAADGHLEEARTGLEKLVKQWPDFVEAHLQLATVYARLHQTELSASERKIVEELNEKARVKGPQPEAAP